MENMINLVNNRMDNMTERNPSMAVRICLTKAQAEQYHDLLDLLVMSLSIKPIYARAANQQGDELVREFYIFAPKHVVDNVRWAERVAKYINSKNIPAMTVRV